MTLERQAPSVIFAYYLPIKRATQGAVTRRDLRPHDYAQIWPDLAEGAQAQTQTKDAA